MHFFQFILISFLAFLLFNPAVKAKESYSYSKKSSIERRKLIDSLINKSANSEYTEALNFAQDALKISKEEGNYKIYSIYRLLAYNYYCSDELNTSDHYAREMIQISRQQNDILLLLNAYNQISATEMKRGRYANAVTYLLITDSIARKHNEYGSSATAQSNLADVYIILKDYDKALKYAQKAHNYYSKEKEVNYYKNLSTIATIYLEQGIYKKSLDLLLISLEYALRNQSDDFTAALYEQIAIVYHKINNPRVSIKYHYDAIKLFQKLKDYRNLGLCYSNLGYLYLEQSTKIDSSLKTIWKYKVLDRSNYNLAKTYFNKSILVINKADASENLIEPFKALAIIKELEGDLYQSFKYHLKAEAINDSLRSAKDRYDIEKQELKHRNRIKEDHIKALREKEVQQSNFRIYGLTIVLIFTIILLFIIYRSRKSTQKLLLNVLPSVIAKRLHKEKKIADHFDNASVIFIDIVNFSRLAIEESPETLVEILNDIFTKLDNICEKHGMEKIKTIGDCYMAAAGIPTAREDHAKAAAMMALDVRDIMNGYPTLNGSLVYFKAGISCGPVVAGVIGQKKFIYDLWGDTVNTACRMEESSKKGEIQVTEEFKRELDKHQDISQLFHFTKREHVEVKGKGKMVTYFLRKATEAIEQPIEFPS